MANSILIAMPKLEDAKKIGGILRSRGYYPAEFCTTGADLLAVAHELDSGIVICTRRLRDIQWEALREDLPEYFDLLLLTSENGSEVFPPGVYPVTMPFQVGRFVETVERRMEQLEYRIRSERRKPKHRNSAERELIDRAKSLLMEQKQMTEPEAFRYIQKTSMDSGTNMVETAQKILMFERK